MTYNNHFVIIT